MRKLFGSLILAVGSIAALVTLSGCQDDKIKDEPATGGSSFEGTVADINGYGMLVPSFTPSDLINAGFEYSDLLDVKIGDNITLHNVPFVTGFNEVGVLETCFCDYNAQGKMYGFGQLNGNFSERIGGKPGDKIEITLSEHLGYKDTWEIMKSIYTDDRNNYASDEVFANFRVVKATGMTEGVLYRSSNPLNPKDNAVRYAYADALAESVGIQTEIDLSDTDEKIRNYRSMEGYASTYCPALYDAGQTIALGLTADVYAPTFMKKLGEGLRFMTTHQPPYLVHCNEGKDRCGFVIMLLEALAGATYEEVTDDYMQTLINFYKIEKGDASYDLRKALSIDRMVWLLENIDAVTDYTDIDWASKDPSKVNLQQAAHDYILKCGLTEGECAKLKSILQIYLTPATTFFALLPTSLGRRSMRGEGLLTF